MNNTFLSIYFLITGYTVTAQHEQPVMRNSACMVFDTRLGEVIMYGGSIHSMNPVKMNDSALWSWNGESWKKRTTVPFLRGDIIFAYDKGSNKVIMQGGRVSNSQRSSTHFNETWESDGTSWIKTVDDAFPGSLAHSAAAYDAERKMMIVFGGHETKQNIMMNETRAYQKGKWTLLETSNAPPARCMHSMFYDPVLKGVVIAGGMNEKGFLNDLWIFGKQGWRQLSTEIPFVAPGAYSVVSLGETGEYLAFASNPDMPASETWIWDKLKWNKLDIAAPSPRNSASIAFDSKRNVVVLFGGEKGRDSFDDTWEFSVKDRKWTEK